MLLLERLADGKYRGTGGTASIERVKGATVMTGYASVFYNAKDPGTEYQLSRGVMERISPRAFDNTLASDRDVIGAYNHNLDFLLGRRSNGTLRLTKDSVGLRYEIDHNPDDPQHVSIMAKLERGDLNGSSFSFQPVKESTATTTTGYIRTIEDLILYELGPVHTGAYSAATAGCRKSSSGEVGSVRWMHDNPHHPLAVDARLRQLRRDRLAHVEREMVLDRLRILQT